VASGVVGIGTIVPGTPARPRLFYGCRILYRSRKEILMGPITGLATIATVLLVGTIVLGVVVVGLTLGVVVPTLAANRTERRRRGLAVPTYYRLAMAH
jgi:hypothetical protein